MNVKEHEKQDMEKAGGWHSLQHLSYTVENLEQCKEGYVTFKLYSTHIYLPNVMMMMMMMMMMVMMMMVNCFYGMVDRQKV